MKHILYSDEILLLIKACPTDIAASDTIIVLATLIHKDLEDRKLLLAASLKLEKIHEQKSQIRMAFRN